MREWLASLFRTEVPLLLIVLLRVVVGYEFVSQGIEKIHQGYLQVAEKNNLQIANPLQLTLETWMTEERTVYKPLSGGEPAGQKVRMFPWYRIFLEQGILPHARIFSTLVTVGEIALGALLIVGLLVRVASVAGIILVLNYLFATWHLGFPYPVLNEIVLASLLVFAIVGAGRCLGIDALLRDKFPEIPLF